MKRGREGTREGRVKLRRRGGRDGGGATKRGEERRWRQRQRKGRVGE